ncbi:DUF6519 domain-containing protein [Kitasatospora sp. NPDC056783]|uniref:DUF6519 domain-containing protein n=1 Tax=Kitasatospora sp. NPDC056783 TaxID=3345943 RepID=UPI00369BA582
MHADLSRVTFRPGKHYSAVLAQQGRVQLDADANEQAAMELHRIRTLTRDLIGDHGGPGDDLGFAIAFQPGGQGPSDLTIGGGRYYVDGILLDADRPRPGVAVPDDGTPAEQTVGPSEHWTYWDQPDAYRDQEKPADRLPDTFPYTVYLKVWERGVTAVEDPSLREVALGAALPDTAARTKVVWQVLAARHGVPDGGTETIRRAFGAWAAARHAGPGLLAARAQRPERADDPCLTHPDAAYRGPENQLYRVEIHRGGPVEQGATFKWSRENGSVVLPVAAIEGSWVDLTTLGGDDKLSLQVGDRVEVGDSAYVSRGEPGELPRVEEVDLPGRRVRLSAEPDAGVGRLAERHPFLRRWDHRATGARGGLALDQGALCIREGAWLDLEDGVQVYFQAGGDYRPGDYWLIPARTVTGAVEWPANPAGEPLLQEPAGVTVHYAPLAYVRGADPSELDDLRRSFGPLSEPVRSESVRSESVRSARGD